MNKQAHEDANKLMHSAELEVVPPTSFESDAYTLSELELQAVNELNAAVIALRTGNRSAAREFIRRALELLNEAEIE